MKSKYIITVDTETFKVNGRVLPFATHHYADLPQGSFGTQRIMDICDHYGAKATFFVDVYMHRHYGESDVASLCKRIDAAGHDVQLHAHTSWFPDARSGLIKDYSLPQQIEIIREGKDLLKKWLGKPPVGFRAGAYGANLDTIRALRENGFLVDSSYFPLHGNCDLNAQLQKSPSNRMFSIEGIVELPVTTYWLLNAGKWRKNSKVDVNACSWKELKNVVPKLASTSADYIILFLHSFSFVDWDENGKNLSPKMKTLETFQMLLEMVRGELDGEFVTVADVARTCGLQEASTDGPVPSLPPFLFAPRLFNRFFG